MTALYTYNNNCLFINEQMCSTNDDNNLLLISELIKNTQSEDLISDNNELIAIAKFIKNIEMNSNNIHSVLKLISNLIKFKFVIESNDEIFDFDVDQIVTSIWPSYNDTVEVSYTDTTISSDTESMSSFPNSDDLDNLNNLDSFDNFKKIGQNKDSKELTDGDVVSLVNIYCSPKYDMNKKAYDIICKYNVHKTSSYSPIFKYLIETNKYEELKIFYDDFVKINKSIIKNNHKIKEYNNKVRQYNEKIKLLKKKHSEITSVIDDILDIGISKTKIFTIKEHTELISDSELIELTIKNERNVIECSNQYVKQIIELGINNSDHDFLNKIMENIEYPTIEIISILVRYFKMFNHEYVMTGIRLNTCQCCNKYIPNNIINSDDRIAIMEKISAKILKTTHRHDNGVVINQSEKQIIVEKWNEFRQLLTNNKFDVVIDGANIGFVNSKGSSEINIKFIQTTIQNIIEKTGKKVLLIMHQRHTNKLKQLTFDKSKAQFLSIYTTPNNLNDDWFWLYASLYYKCRILTNDQSRDHGYMVSYQLEIKRWVANYQVKIEPNSLSYIKELMLNKEYSVKPGIFTDNNSLHIIYKFNDSTFNCVCVDINKN